MAGNGSGTARGLFISFEGGDGAGKTTHLNYLAQSLRSLGREVVCLREPGGTTIGESLRAVVLDPANGELCDQAELLIYEAARAQLVAQVVAPALERGAIVLCDRFADSTVAYQVHGRGLPSVFVEQANAFACQGTTPDRTILMLASESPQAAQLGLARATDVAPADRLESAGAGFHEAVMEGFLEVARHNPARVKVVVSSGARSETALAVHQAVADLFGWESARECFGEAHFAAFDEQAATGKAVVEGLGAAPAGAAEAGRAG